MKKTLLLLSLVLGSGTQMNAGLLSLAFGGGSPTGAPKMIKKIDKKISNYAAHAWKYKTPIVLISGGISAIGSAAQATYEMIASGSLEGFSPEKLRAIMCVDEYFCALPLCRAVVSGLAAPLLIGCGIVLTNDILANDKRNLTK